MIRIEEEGELTMTDEEIGNMRTEKREWLVEMNGKVRIERGNKIKDRAEREQPLGKQ